MNYGLRIEQEEVRMGYKFVNIYNEVEEGEPISIDIRKLSLAVPARLP